MIHSISLHKFIVYLICNICAKTILNLTCWSPSDSLSHNRSRSGSFSFQKKILSLCFVPKRFLFLFVALFIDFLSTSAMISENSIMSHAFFFFFELNDLVRRSLVWNIQTYFCKPTFFFLSLQFHQLHLLWFCFCFSVPVWFVSYLDLNSPIVFLLCLLVIWTKPNIHVFILQFCTHTRMFTY